MIRNVLLLLTLASALSLPAADPFTYKSPKGWRHERIPFPLGFAPELEYQGFEELRFGPGMFQPKSDTYWTYAFFWWVKGDAPITAASLKTDLTSYYLGLSHAVGSGRGLKIAPEKITVKLKPTIRTKSKPTSPIFSGTLQTYDAFATGKLLKLNFEVSRSYFKESDHTWVFFSVSPLKPDNNVWKQMHAFRDSFRVKP